MAEPEKKPDAHKRHSDKEKYSPDQKAAAEQKVVDQNVQANEKRGKMVDSVVNDIVKKFDELDYSGRTRALDEIAHRVLTIKPVAANSKLRPSRGDIYKEEKLTMPRLTPSAAPGEDVRRNIMQQGEQNKTDALKEKK